MQVTHAVFPVQGLLAVPWRNTWASLTYTATAAFEADPFTIPAGSTSGSPVAFTDDLFVGFLTTAGGQFRYDGAGELRVSIPPGQELFVRRGANPYTAWREYTATILGGEPVPRRDPPLYRMIEYNTWVEQKAGELLPHPRRLPPTEAFIEDYLARIAALGFPPGKVTVDAGWYDGNTSHGAGTFEANDWFPERRVAAHIRAAGHVPGIWLNLGIVAPESRYARAHPDLVKPHTYWGRVERGTRRDGLLQAIPSEPLARQFRETLARLIDAGYRKFKLDILYGNKHEMRETLSLAYAIAHELLPDVEIEAHIPDVFVSRFCDVVRTNDVLIADDKPWRALTLAHWTVCHHSAPDRWLNLDHIGGNNPAVTEAHFLEHLAMYERVPGHPVVSLLPDRYTGGTQSAASIALGQFLRVYDAQRNDTAYFTNIPTWLGDR